MLKLMRRCVMVVVACLLLGTVLQMPSGEAQAEEVSFDTIIRNGTIIDGSGLPRYNADIGLRNGFIARIGDLDDVSAETDLDAEGLFVTPGFIDIHSHASLSALQEAKSSLTQGVTTEILSPDGGGPTDITERFALEEDGLAINIGTYIGFNSIWRDVVGNDDRRATAEEIRDMQALVSQAMEDGAFGVSAGLQYTPAYYADTDEVIDVVSAAKDWRTNFPNHIRNQDNEVVESTAETIEIGEGAGLVPVITHIKVVGPGNWGKSQEMLELIEEAWDRGTYAAADVYPYLRSQQGVTTLVPKWVEDGGRSEMLKRFADPELRQQIEQEIEEILQTKAEGPEDVYFPTTGKTLADYMEEGVAGDGNLTPGEAVMQMLETHGNLTSILNFGSEDDLKRFMQHPTTAIASDGGATTSSSTHPRRYGSQPRVLGKYVREEGYLEWEEAIRKMTGLPATIIGMTDRGLIAEGMVADITVFDPETVIDHATFDEPKQYSEGMEYVIVNGELALFEGEVTGKQAGKALKRAPNMPSRPMNPSESIHVEGIGELHPIDQPSDDESWLQIDYSLDQDAHARQAEGHFRISDEKDELDFEAEGLGKIQVTDGWVSFTGRGTLNGNEERTFLVIIDENEPMMTDQRPTITVYIEGMDEIRGFLGETDAEPSSIEQMKSLVETFVDEGDITNDAVARLLQTHLTVVGHYEVTDATDKAIKHMNSFKRLLDYQEQNELISERASGILTTHADNLISKWQ